MKYLLASLIFNLALAVISQEIVTLSCSDQYTQWVSMGPGLQALMYYVILSPFNIPLVFILNAILED